MAKKKEEPIITQTEILAIAGRSIQEEIIDKRRETNELAERLKEVGKQKDADYLRDATERQLTYHMERLKAIETMYEIQTGTALGLMDEL